MRPLGYFETSNTDYQMTRRRKPRKWKSEGEDFIAGKQKLCDAGHHCVL